MSVTIHQLELENVKRIKAVSITPAETGLTIIGGRNNQGKTSVLDAIAWALGGNKHKPSQAQRLDAPDMPRLRVTLSNGIVVERSGKNSTLKVTDPTGQRGGQQLLSSFLEELALDLPRFLEASDREKADTLLQIIGVKDELEALDSQENTLYYQRRAVGQQADQRAKYAEGLPYVEGAPEEPVSVQALLAQQQAILLRNADNRRKREQLANLEREQASLRDQIDLLTEQLARVSEDVETARQTAAGLEDQSTAELEASLADIDRINQAVRTNQAKRQAKDAAAALGQQYKEMTAQIEAIRTQRRHLLDAADLPLPGLSVQDGALRYNGQRWDCMSGSDQLRVAVAIVRRLNPECGFVLLDKLEQMDLDTLRDFGQWLEAQGLQAIATRVSTGDECSIIIEDGFSQPAPANPQPAADLSPAPRVTWTPGKF